MTTPPPEPGNHPSPYGSQDPYGGQLPPGGHPYPEQLPPAQGPYDGRNPYPQAEPYPAQQPYPGQLPPDQGPYAVQQPYDGYDGQGGGYPHPDPYAAQVPYPGHEPYAAQPPYPGHVPPGGQQFGAAPAPPGQPPGPDPYAQAGGPYGFGNPDEPYVPEPLGGQLPEQSDPGAAFGAPSSGDAWGGQPPAAQAYAGPGAVDGWGQPPAPAPAWDAQAEPAHAYAAAAVAEPHAGEQTAVMEPIRHQEHAEFAAPPAAPVRTGSPIIPPGIQPAALTAALGLLMAGGAAVGRPLLAVVLVLLEGVTAAGWFRLNGMWPARQGIVLAFLAGVTADVALLASSGGHNAEVLLGTLGGWLVPVLVLQLRHHGSADERLASLTATSASTLLTVLAACWLAAAVSGAGTDPVVVGAVAVAAATVVRAVPLPVRGPAGDAVSLVLAVLAAAATALATGPGTGFGSGHAALLAAACGVCAAIGLRVASYDFPSRFVHFTAGVALPLTAAAPVVYLLGNVWS